MKKFSTESNVKRFPGEVADGAFRRTYVALKMTKQALKAFKKCEDCETERDARFQLDAARQSLRIAVENMDLIQDLYLGNTVDW